MKTNEQKRQASLAKAVARDMRRRAGLGAAWHENVEAAFAVALVLGMIFGPLIALAKLAEYLGY